MKKPSTKKTVNKPAPAKDMPPKKRGRPAKVKAAETADAKPSSRAPHAVKRGHNLVDPKNKALFLQHLGKHTALKERLGNLQADIRNLGKTIKADGFTMAQIKFAAQLSSPEGEATARSLLADNLLAAAYVDSDLGEQLSLFMEMPETPSVDRAYKEGQTCSMNNLAAVPSYAPGTDQYDAFMKGYHEHQESLITKGMKKLDEAKATDNASGKSRKRNNQPNDAVEDQATADDGMFDEVEDDNGEPITRSEFMRRQSSDGGGQMH